MSKAPQLNVCLVAPVPPPFNGGIGRWSHMLVRYVAGRADVRLDVVDISVRWRQAYDLAVWKRAIGGTIQMIRDCFRLVTCLRRKPDVVHLTTPGGLATLRDHVMSRIAARMGVPVVYHLRFGEAPDVLTRGTFEARNFRATLRRVSCVVPIDLKTEAALSGWSSARRVVRIPNCVDFGCLPRQRAVEEAPPIVMFLGNVIPTKGIAELLEAWRELQPEGWRLRIVGEYAPDYRKKLEMAYPSETVEFVGDKAHSVAMKLLAQASIFVLPSYTEGFPNAVLEAMALGRAIIGTRVGAIPEMLDEDCGLLISPKCPEEVKEALKVLIANRELREKLGARARFRAAEEYSLDSVFSRYKQVWKETSGL